MDASVSGAKGVNKEMALMLPKLIERFLIALQERCLYHAGYADHRIQMPALWTRLQPNDLER